VLSPLLPTSAGIRYPHPMAAPPLAAPAPTASTNERPWRALTWAVFAVTAAALLAAIVVWASNDFAIPPITFYKSTWIVVTEWLVIVVPGSIGLLLGLHLPGSRVALALALIGLVVSLQNLADMLVATPSFATTAIGPAVAWATSTFTFSFTTMLVVLLVLVFPTGRLVAPTWGLAAWLAGIGSLLLVLYQGFAPGNLSWYHNFPNPIGVPAGTEAWLRASWYIGNVCVFVALIAAGWSMVVRYRATDAVGRQQLKWFVYGIGVLLFTALAEVASFLFLPPDSSLGELSLAGLFVGASLLPVATAIGVMRYGLYEIDVLINRTFVFGALTAVLAGLYAAGIRLFQVLFVAVTGQESDAALVLTTLVLATTFTPIKSRLEGIAARRYVAHPGLEPAAATASPLADPALRALIADVVREELARRDRPGPGDPQER
jgi:hypothetical protein